VQRRDGFIYNIDSISIFRHYFSNSRPDILTFSELNSVLLRLLVERFWGLDKLVFLV